MQANRLTAHLARALAPRIRWKPAAFRRIAAEHHLVLPPRTLEALDAGLNLIASLFPYLNAQTTDPTEIAVGPI